MISTARARLYLDTNVLIYHLEASPTWGSRAGALLRECVNGVVAGVVGDAVMAEVMVGVHRSGAAGKAEAVMDFLTCGVMEVASHDHDAFLTAAAIRGQYGGQLLDALHVATAMAAGCDAIISHDERMPRLPELPVLRLDEWDLNR